ncbi:MAG: hypothetical protein FWG24_04060 [Eggerthellaceae bacterium]|jgi:hypothetical protein|nr:hypothetical protein [Eggerthellaceae bacterium]MDR2721904.1 hypothetical protein [Coriobacteriaceae bacterium]
MKRSVRWIFLSLLIIELILLFSGLIPAHISVVLIAITEATALVLGLSIVVPAVVKIVRKTRSGMSVGNAIQQEFKEILPKKILFLVGVELGIWASIYRFVTKKKDVPKGSVELKYGSEFRRLALVLLCLSPLEIIGVEFLLVHFQVPLIVHLVVIIVTLYVLMWLVGFTVASLVYPHYINAEKLVFRYSCYHNVVITPDALKNVQLSTRGCVKNKTIEVYEKDKGRFMALNDMRSTNVLLTFKQPYRLMLNGEETEDSFIGFSFKTDEPQLALESLQTLCFPDDSKAS